MTEGALSRRYGKAFFQLAEEEKREDAVGQEIEQFVNAYTSSALQTVLNNPAFDAERRKKILLEVAKALQLSSLSVHFLSILLERDRLNYLPSIGVYYRRLLNEKRGRVEAKVVSARDLDEAALTRLREALHGISGKEVILHQETNPELIGGLLVELEGKIYDGSVRTQLENMKQRIMRPY
jgi:F-type H+-transporting ATPase subunit delta